MAKTLAELVEQGNDPQKYVGMRCDSRHSSAKGSTTVVLGSVIGDLCWVSHTDLPEKWSLFSLEDISPRFDLRRAWPNSTPVPTNKWGIPTNG